MARKLKITENEKYTLQDVKYGEETEKGGKFRNVHCRTLYWLVLCQLDTAGVTTEKGASVEEMPP